MDDEYEGEANADLTLGILSKARNRPNTHLSLSPETQAFFVSEEPQEIIELASDDGDDDNSVEIVNDKRRLDGGIAAANPKRRKAAPNFVQGEVSSPSDPGDGKSAKKVKKKRSKKAYKQQKENKRRQRQEEKEKPDDEASPEAAEAEAETPIVKKVSRGRRYFDPPAEAQKCFKCNEVGHFAASCTKTSLRCLKCGVVGHVISACTSRRQKKGERPHICFGCGGSHSSKDCKFRVQCTHCEEFWHQSQDCPQKTSPRLCALCGDPAHQASSCSKYFFPDDLKEVQCYVCRQFGHLCCVDGLEKTPQQLSCYNCGEGGHTGMTCGKPVSPPVKKGPPAKKTPDTPAKKCPECKQRNCTCVSCYKCGRRGHFARDCKRRVPAAEGSRTNEDESFNRDFNNNKRRRQQQQQQQQRPQRAEPTTRLPKWYEVEERR